MQQRESGVIYMPAGRPKIDFDQKTFEELCRIQCTETEIAAVMDMSIDTLDRRCKEIYGVNFADIYTQKREGGKSSLRRAQWQTAIDAKNPVMQIFLGKNFLGQTDKQEIEHNLSGPIRVSFSRDE